MKVSAAIAITSHPALRGKVSSNQAGYRLSSDELQAGLEVETVSINSLPVEVVSELLRLRRTWGPAANADSLQQF